ncbi:MAG: phosphotransferase [Acidobacteria bacterium]|nr:phosphotransferase [Acidobacteriota bacterium]
MLTKLWPRENADAVGVSRRNDARESLFRYAGAGLEDVQPCSGGTFSLCLTARWEGRARFFKTVFGDGAEASLSREVDFLRATTGKRTDASLFQCESAGCTDYWLVMNQLEPSTGLLPAQVRAVVAGYDQTFRATHLGSAIPGNCDISLLLAEAEHAVNELHEDQQLSREVSLLVHRCLAQLRKDEGQWSRSICHGDLGPANLMEDPDGVVVVDWEDAIWAPSGYDYLYWVTFLTNRRWLVKEELNVTGLGLRTEIALMVMIVLLKSVIGVRSKASATYTIGINERLSEILNLA